MTSVFLDANIYYSASRSPLGGSAELCRIIRARKLKIYATSLVLLEAERNIRKKEPATLHLAFYKLIENLKPKIINIDQRRAEDNFLKIINSKDTYVLEGARRARVDYLVTLDKKDFFTKKVKGAKLPFEILTPGQLILKLREALINLSKIN